MTGTLMLSRLVRDDVMKDLVFTGRILHATEGATLGLVTRLADDPVEVALHMARDIAGRSPHAVRGAKKLINPCQTTARRNTSRSNARSSSV